MHKWDWRQSPYDIGSVKVSFGLVQSIISKSEAASLYKKFKQFHCAPEDVWTLDCVGPDEYDITEYTIGDPSSDGCHYEDMVARTFDMNVDGKAVGELLIAAQKYLIPFLKQIAES